MSRDDETTEDEASDRQRLRRIVFWVAFWLVAQGIAGAYGLWLSYDNDQEYAHLVRVKQVEVEVEAAIRCVDSWEIAAQSRMGDERVYRRITETLIEASNPPPDRLAEYRRLIERDVEEIRGVIDNPLCDLEAAERLLGG